MRTHVGYRVAVFDRASRKEVGVRIFRTYTEARTYQQSLPSGQQGALTPAWG